MQTCSRYPEDYQKLKSRARKMTCSLIRAWARKLLAEQSSASLALRTRRMLLGKFVRFYMRCYPKLFCNVGQAGQEPVWPCRCLYRFHVDRMQEFMSTFVDLMQVKMYAAGDVICAEGDPGNFGRLAYMIGWNFPLGHDMHPHAVSHFPPILCRCSSAWSPATSSWNSKAEIHESLADSCREPQYLQQHSPSELAQRKPKVAEVVLRLHLLLWSRREIRPLI